METLEYIEELLKEKNIKEIKTTFLNLNEIDAAELMADLPYDKATFIFRLLPKDFASALFAELDSDIQQRIISSATDKEIAALIEEQMIDDAVDALEELPASVVKRILSNVSPDMRKAINQFLAYPENSVGSVMTAELMGVKKDMTVIDALRTVRKNASALEQVYYCYVTDNEKMLEGVVSLKELLAANDDAKVSDLMDTNVIFTRTTADQEEAALLVKKYDLLSIPVVDSEGRLVGIVTVDDVMDVIEQEDTEDIAKMAGVVPSTEEYLKTSIFTLARNRIFWLVFLMFSSVIASMVLTKEQAVFASMPILVAFIPMLMDAGGNAGSQTASIIIRSMAIGEISHADFPKVLFKEFRIAVLVAIALASCNFVRMCVQYPGDLSLAAAVCASLFITVTSAKIVGCCLPFIAKLIHIDPALMAAPVISTIMDAYSLLFYFLICRLVFGI